MPALLRDALTLLPTLDQLAALAARSTALLVLAWLGASLLRRNPPRVRQALWTSVVAGVLLLPLLSSVLPAWKVLPAAIVASPIDLKAGLPVLAPAAPVAVLHRATVLPGPLPTPSEVAWSWSQLATLSWVLGSVVVALAFLLGLLRLRAITRSAAPADPQLLARARELAAKLGIRRPVRVLSSHRLASPATWGVVRPVIVVPRAARRWDAERRDLVLAHELVHVARFDWGWRLLAQLGCSAYWFNPLSWLAARRLRLEQEMACDLAVVELGTRPSTYAYHLLNIARAAGAARALPLAGLDMARRSQMEGRLMSILTDRPAGTLHRGLLLPALCILVALPVLAAVQPKAPEAAPTPAAREVPELATAAVAVASPLQLVAPSPAPEVPQAVSAVPAIEPKVVTVAPVAAVPLATPTPVIAAAPVAVRFALAAPDAVGPLAIAAPVVAKLAGAAMLAPLAPAIAPQAVLEALAAPSQLDAREREIAERIALKAAEIEALVRPVQEELERQMEEELYPVLERLASIELEMRPFHEEMSRIGEEMSRAMELQMPEALEMEELALQAEAIGLEMEKRAELTGRLAEATNLDRQRMNEAVRELNESLVPLREQFEVLRERMEAHRLSAEDMRARMEPYRERMEQLRLELEPQRLRMEAIRRQLEPVRQRMESLRQERMAEFHARMEVMRAELAALRRERAAERANGAER
ncbi:MAG: hypothetical protein O7A98_00975 [Acidobacteria bacterium]|nr:hypothetical protein [Acidobacteriota bacterium]